MNEYVKQVIQECLQSGRLDEELFINYQKKIPFEKRGDFRFSPEIASMYFGVEHLDKIDTEYYYWDNTTLCFKKPLLQYVKDNDTVLEVGPGPSATMSIFLQKNKKNLRSVCSEINKSFIKSAKHAAELNHVNLQIIESDMAIDLEDKFDVIFMNPPYVKEKTISELNIDKESHEGRSGAAGEDGSSVVEKFLDKTPRILKKDGTALLGINTRHLEDEITRKHIEKSQFKLVTRYYSQAIAQPLGPYSQIYVLKPIAP